VRIVGPDAASDLKKFGYVVCSYRGGDLELEQKGLLSEPGAQGFLVKCCTGGRERTLLAIDAPLGWPSPLGDSLVAHQAGDRLVAQPNNLFRRETDRWVRREIGKQSLDIGADKIARAAWRALDVLNELRTLAKQPIPLAWGPDFGERVAAIEVYPAATLKAHGLDSGGYKEASADGSAARKKLAKEKPFGKRAPWLVALSCDSVDVFDAGLCAIAGADFLDGLAPPPENMQLARKEGWIWVKAPKTPLGTPSKNQGKRRV
jgi:hypothetical protein